MTFPPLATWKPGCWKCIRDCSINCCYIRFRKSRELLSKKHLSDYTLVFDFDDDPDEGVIFPCDRKGLVAMNRLTSHGKKAYLEAIGGTLEGRPIHLRGIFSRKKGSKDTAGRKTKPSAISHKNRLQEAFRYRKGI